MVFQGDQRNISIRRRKLIADLVSVGRLFTHRSLKCSLYSIMTFCLWAYFWIYVENNNEGFCWNSSGIDIAYGIDFTNVDFSISLSLAIFLLFNLYVAFVDFDKIHGNSSILLIVVLCILFSSSFLTYTRIFPVMMSSWGRFSKVASFVEDFSVVPILMVMTYSLDVLSHDYWYISLSVCLITLHVVSFRLANFVLPRFWALLAISCSMSLKFWIFLALKNAHRRYLQAKAAISGRNIDIPGIHILGARRMFQCYSDDIIVQDVVGEAISGGTSSTFQILRLYFVLATVEIFLELFSAFSIAKVSPYWQYFICSILNVVRKLVVVFEICRCYETYFQKDVLMDRALLLEALTFNFNLRSRNSSLREKILSFSISRSQSKALMTPSDESIAQPSLVPSYAHHLPTIDSGDSKSSSNEDYGEIEEINL